MPPSRKKTTLREAASAAKSSGAADAYAALPFEQAIEQLEGLVETLEDGELDLEASLAAFERGVALSKHCASQLDAAERRIELLVEQGGELLAKPFDTSSVDDDHDDEDSG